MPGAHVRAAVYDADGPVGAQIMQRLDSGGIRSSPTERKHADRAGNSRGAHGTWGDFGAAARSAARDTGTVNGSGRRRARDSSPGRTRDSDRGDPGDLSRDDAPAAHSPRDSRREDSSDAPGRGAPAVRLTRDTGRENSSDAPGTVRGFSSRTSGRNRSPVDAASDESFSPGASGVRESSAEDSRGDSAGRASGSAAGNGSADASEPPDRRTRPERAGRESGSSTTESGPSARASSGGRSRPERSGRASGSGAKNGFGAGGRSASGSGAGDGPARDADPGASPSRRGRGEGSRSADTSSGDAGSPPTSGGVTERDSGRESGAGGRHEAGGRTPFRAEESGSEGNRHRRSNTESPSQPAQEETRSTEGLGIADLLAGALAAYRGI
jgi:hypothetical protein